MINRLNDVNNTLSKVLLDLKKRKYITPGDSYYAILNDPVTQKEEHKKFCDKYYKDLDDLMDKIVKYTYELFEEENEVAKHVMLFDGSGEYPIGNPKHRFFKRGYTQKVVSKLNWRDPYNHYVIRMYISHELFEAIYNNMDKASKYLHFILKSYPLALLTDPECEEFVEQIDEKRLSFDDNELKEISTDKKGILEWGTMDLQLNRPYKEKTY